MTVASRIVGNSEVILSPDKSGYRTSGIAHQTGQTESETPRLLYDLTELVEVNEDDFGGGGDAHGGAPGSGAAGGVDG